MLEVDAGWWEVDDQGSSWRFKMMGVIETGLMLVICCSGSI